MIRKGPKAEDDDDALHALLWGDQKFSSSKATSEDDGEGAKKKRKVQRNRNGSTTDPAREDTEAEGVKGSSGSMPAFGRSWTGAKRAAAETREMDKCEACILQVRQLQNQIEDPRTVMQVGVQKVSSCVDKIQTRLDEGTKIFMEVVRQEGQGCRAEQVWQQLKDSKALADAMRDFVEAIHDQEAAAATVAGRATSLRDKGVKLPRNVNIVICKRSAEEFVKDGKMEYVFNFLDDQNDERSTEGYGIRSILEEKTDENKDAVEAMAKEFQVGCVGHIVNTMLLAEFQGSGERLGFFLRSTVLLQGQLTRTSCSSTTLAWQSSWIL